MTLGQANKRPPPQCDQALLEAVPAGLCLFDASDLAVVAHNRLYQSFLDEPYRSTGVVGLCAEEFVAGRDRDRVLAVLRRAAAGECVAIQGFSYASPTRGQTHWDLQVAPLRDERGKVSWMLLTLMDAAERIAAEERPAQLARSLRTANERLAASALQAHAAGERERHARQEMERLLRERERQAGDLSTIISAIADPVLVFDASGTVVRANPAAVATFGFDPTGCRRDTICARLRMRHPDGRPLALAEMPASPALHGMTVTDLHFVFTDCHGDDVSIAATAAPLSADGLVFGAVVVWHDVSERERLIEEIQRDRERLRREQQWREDYVRMISHDIRQPLTVVQGQAQMLGRLLEQGKTDVARQSSAAIVANAQRMAAMIRDLVDSARLEAGRIDLRRQRVDLSAMVAGLLGQLRQSQPNGRLQVDGTAERFIVDADPVYLERILANLLSNALKYSQPETEVTVRLARRGDQAMIAVADRGPGIPAEDLPHIFERYYRAVTEHRKEGLGLGLYITRLLVEAHGGRVHVESTPGAGSTFYVLLPLLTDDPTGGTL